MTESRIPSDRSRSLLWWGLAVALIALFFLTRYMLRDELPVREAQVSRETLTKTVNTNGRVEPEVNNAFYSPIATTVKAVYAQPGDTVPAGKLLMVLDDVAAKAQLASAESGVKAAQATLEAATHNGTQEERAMAGADVTRSQLERSQAQRDLDALLSLEKTGAASTSEVEAARERLNTATANLNAAQQTAHDRYSPAEIARAKAALADAEASLASAQQVLAQTQIRAPIAGTVYTVDVQSSDFVPAGTLLLQMADLHHERVRAYFDEPDIGELAVGQQIQIKWDGRQGREWNGHILRTPVTVVTYGTRSVGEVLVEIDDSDSGLLPKTNVTVTAITSSAPNTLCVPREALHSQNGKPYVFRILNDKLVRTSVVTGTANMTDAAILSGLEEGAWVATGTTNGQPLQEGVPIKVVR